MNIQLNSLLTCPACAHTEMLTMPKDACQWFYECPNCHTLLKPNGHGNVTTPDNETCHARSLTPVPPLPKGEGYSSSLREFHVKPGDCCVFCSYGSVPCPPIQAGNDDCYRP